MRTKVSLGIDIGGTNIAYGVIDKEGKCVMTDSKPIKLFDTPQEFIVSLHQEIEERLATLDADLIGVGVGAPDGNYFTGTIEHAANLNWKGRIPFTELLRETFALPAFLTNDAKAAALGEMIYGGAKGMKDFAVITLGTGLGSGIVVNGQLLYGHDGLAGEVGHTIVVPGGRACGCGRRGCLETYASATGIKRTACELLAKENASHWKPSAIRARYWAQPWPIWWPFFVPRPFSSKEEPPTPEICCSLRPRNTWNKTCSSCSRKRSEFYHRPFPPTPPFTERPH